MQKLKVLLVDDEPYILQGLKVIIDWEGMDCEIIGMAHNGVEAYAIIESEKPNIVISDIMMPEMDGIALLKKARLEAKSDANFIFLSGYDDFEYVRSALKYNTLEYLLKPVEEEELTNAVIKAKNIQKARESQTKINNQNEKNLFASSLISIMRGKQDRDSISTVKNHIGAPSYISLFVIELDNQDAEIKQDSIEEKKQMQQLLYSKCANLLGDEYLCIYNVLAKNGSYDVGILLIDENSTDEAIKEFKAGILESIDFPVRTYAGKRVNDISRLAESYKSISIADFLQNFEANSGKSIKNEKEDAFASINVSDLVEAIERNSFVDIRYNVNLLYDFLTTKDEHMVSLVINHLLFEMINLASKIDGNINQEEILRYISSNVFDNSNPDNDKENLLKIFTDFSKYLTDLRSNQTSGVLGLVEADIIANYKENLTLKELGQKYYLNAAYLGQLFKAKKGMSFKEYLHSVRIEKAENLLLTTDMKIMEVAENVGYKDMDYFINHFIAKNGCTPAKYRKQLRG